MKIEKRNLMAFALALLFLIPSYKAPASPIVQRKKQVRVYLYRESSASASNPLGLSPVMRTVSAAAPAHPALQALLDGPTAAEERRGYMSMNVKEFDIASLTIRNGTARVNFVASRTWPGWAGDLSPGRFKQAVTRTLRQFPTVRRVVVSVNGDPNFDSGRGE